MEFIRPFQIYNQLGKSFNKVGKDKGKRKQETLRGRGEVSEKSGKGNLGETNLITVFPSFNPYLNATGFKLFSNTSVQV